MHALFRTLGLCAWGACILVLTYQALMWVISASWPTMTLMDVTSDLLGVDLVTLVKSLPIEFALKTTYLLVTIELSIALWWMGVCFFGLTFISKVVFGK